MSTRGSANLPTFDWGSVLRRVPGLVALVDADGRLAAISGRLFDEDPDVLELTHAWQLAAPAHRERLREAVQQVVAEGGVARVVVRSRRVDRLYAVELAADERSDRVVMVWAGSDGPLEISADELELEELDPELVETPISPERRSSPVHRLTAPTASPPSQVAPPAPVPSPATSPEKMSGAAPVLASDFGEPLPPPPEPEPGAEGQTGSASSPEYVIVAPDSLRRLAGRLQRTLDLVTPRTAVWFDDAFEGRANKLSPESKLLFLGGTKYGDFLRRVVKPSFDEAGCAWGLRERKVVFWVHDAGEEDEIRRLYDKAMSRVGQVSLSRLVSLDSSGEPPSGKELAGKFLLEPSPTRPSLEVERYLVAISYFLLDGFEELAGIKRNGKRR